MTEQTAKKPRGKRLKKLGLWTVGLVLVLVLGVVATVMALVGSRIEAPDWLHDRVMAEINTENAGVQVDFGQMAVVLQEDWVPRIELQNVQLKDRAGTPLAQLQNVTGTVAPGPLMRGQIRPGTVKLSGARVLVRRARDGAVDLQLGGSGAAESVPSLAALVQEIDSVFQTPTLSSLTRVSVEHLSLQYDDVRAGKSWAVDGGRVNFTRINDVLDISTDFALLGDRGYATTLDIGYRSEIGSTQTEFSISIDDMPARDIAGQLAALSWLNALDAPISGALTVRVDEEGNLGPLAGRLASSGGALTPNDASLPILFESAAAAFTYDPYDYVIRFERLEVDSKWVHARIQGQTHLDGMEDGWPDALVSQFRIADIQANPAQVYEVPLSLEGATLDMRHVLDPFEITLGELSVTDQGQNLLRLGGTVRADTDGWDVVVGGYAPQITPERLLELWPQSLKPKTRKWIAENVKSGELTNVQLALQAAEGVKPDIFLGFDFDKLETRFIKNVPHIKQGRGSGRIQNNQFVIAAHAGHVEVAQGGKLDITGSSFEIPDISIKGGPGIVRLNVAGTITAGLSLLNSGPFGYLDKAGQPVTLADGRAKVQGRLDFRVIDKLRPEDVKFTMSGTLRDVRSETLLKGRVLAASELWIKATDERLQLGGKGRVGVVPFEGEWDMPLVKGSNGRAQVTGSVELSERFMDEFKIALPPGSVSGAGRGQIGIAFEKGVAPKFTLSSDLAGLALRLKPLNWSIGAGTKGELRVSGTLGEPPSVDDLVLNAGGLRARGSVTLNPDGQLQLASFSRVQLDSWIDAPVDLLGAGVGRPPLIRVRGGTVDLRKTSLAGGGDRSGNSGSTGGGAVSVRLDKLQISDGIALTDFNAELDMSKGADGTFTGKVNGQAPIKGRVRPQDGRSAFIITSQNAGAVFRSANLLKQARDGRMELYLVPGKGAGVYEGKLQANGLRIKDAPAMAALLNAISLVGILEQMAGEGIHFAEVEAKFQLAPDRVTLYSGSAVGASMGISVEGYYYLETNWLDMEGVISPIYAVNAVGRIFARKGEGLLGFTYDVDGVASNPRVKVNPLSVLTPGMFRDIFRRQPPARTGQTPQPGSTGQGSGQSSGQGVNQNKIQDR